MNTTQQHLSISAIQDDILLLKNGGGALVLQVSAVNFGLLSDREQAAIVSAFAQMLNSLSFTIQIVIRSERLNINSYLQILDRAQKVQTNSQLSEMIVRYKNFIQATIKENEVLDKKFYIVIPLFSIEVGLKVTTENLKQKIKTVLVPRRDQIIRQMNRVGLKATQLSNQKLIELFYNIYNEAALEKPTSQIITPRDLAVRLKNPTPKATPNPIYQPTTTQISSGTANQQRQSQAGPTGIQTPLQEGQGSKTHPFIVEELEDNI